jgi:hypothetical protein
MIGGLVNNLSKRIRKEEVTFQFEIQSQYGGIEENQQE